MIRSGIATAALNEQVEQRIRIAASLLPAYRIGAKVRPRDGTRCGLLITDLSDAYGRHALTRAKKRCTPILAICDNPADIETECVAVSESSPAPVLAQHPRELLTRDLPAESAAAVDANDSLPALCRLAAPEYRGQPVDAICNGRTIHIRPVEGRVYANTLSDLLSACDVTDVEVKASLWAYQASNLLSSSDNSVDAIHPASAPTARFSGILGRNANRFGLGRH